MTTTAAELKANGLKLFQLGKKEEALKCYEEAVSAEDPTNAVNFSEIGLKLAEYHKSAAAVEAYTRYLKKDPTHSECHRWKANSLLALRRFEEALENFNFAISTNPSRINTYAMRGSVLEALGRQDEAMQNYDKCISMDSNHYLGNQYKADLLFLQGKKDEAYNLYQKLLSRIPYASHPSARVAGILMERGETEKAMEFYRNADKMSCSDPLHYVDRGRCYSALGMQDKALADFKAARESMKTTQIFLTDAYTRFINETLKLVLDTDEIAKENEELVKKLDQKDPSVLRFIQSIQLLKDNKDELQKYIVNQVDNSNKEEQKQQSDSLEAIKKQFEAKLAEMQLQMTQIATKVQVVEHKIAELENELQDIKEDLNNKLDDFKKKLTSELMKQDKKPEEIAKLTDYFNAFLETFSSIYVTSQVVDSGQIKLDVGNNAASVLSFLASFTPFFGNGLSEGIKSIQEFLGTKEMKTNARKVKGMACDTSELSQVVGKSAYDIIINNDKQSQICAITEKDLMEASNNVIGKLRQLLNKTSENLDFYLYSRLYKTPAARLGHNDANELLKKWVKDDFGCWGVHEQFTQHILAKLSSKEGAEADGETPKEIPIKMRSQCCNTF